MMKLLILLQEVEPPVPGLIDSLRTENDEMLLVMLALLPVILLLGAVIAVVKRRGN